MTTELTKAAQRLIEASEAAAKHFGCSTLGGCTLGRGWYCCACKAPMLSLALQLFGKPPAAATHPTKDAK